MDLIDKIGLHRLYKMTLDTFKSKGEIPNGICSIFTELFTSGKITDYENILISKHFRTQKPTRELHQEFYAHRNFNGGVFWWVNYSRKFMSTSAEDDDEKQISKEQRILFLEKMIEITKPNYAYVEVATKDKR